jgi:hypothetical protein
MTESVQDRVDEARIDLGTGVNWQAVFGVALVVVTVLGVLGALCVVVSKLPAPKTTTISERASESSFDAYPVRHDSSRRAPAPQETVPPLKLAVAKIPPLPNELAGTPKFVAVEKKRVQAAPAVALSENEEVPPVIPGALPTERPRSLRDEQPVSPPQSNGDTGLFFNSNTVAPGANIETEGGGKISKEMTELANLARKAVGAFRDGMTGSKGH